MSISQDISFDGVKPRYYTQFMNTGDDWNGQEPLNKISDGMFSGDNLVVPPDPGSYGGKFSFGNKKRLKVVSITMSSDTGQHWNASVDRLQVSRPLASGGPGVNVLLHSDDHLGFIEPGEALVFKSSGSSGTRLSKISVEIVTDIRR